MVKFRAQAFLDKGRPHGKSFTVIHTREGLEAFHSFLKQLEEKTDQQPMVILELTGHYRLPVTRILETTFFSKCGEIRSF